MKKIYLITSNPGKQHEIIRILRPECIKYNIEIETLDMSVPEIQGTGDEIILDKMKSAAKLKSDGILLCEDSALCFHA